MNGLKQKTLVKRIHGHYTIEWPKNAKTKSNRKRNRAARVSRRRNR